MCSCLRQSFALPKKLFISNMGSSSKSFSSLTKLQDRHNSNCYTNNLFNNNSTPKQIQYRYFSLQNTNSIFESVRTSEAGKFFTSTLIGAHDFTGLSWTVTIIAATAVMKFLVTVPCGIYQQYVVARLEQTKIELNDTVKKIKDETNKRAIKGHWTQSKFQSEFQKEVKQMWKTLVVKNNCHPFKINILFFVQLPFWLLLTITIRSLAMDAHSSNASQMENPMTALQFQVGGPFWCQNLSLPDPTLILPTISALSMLISTEVSFLSRTKVQNAQNFKSFLANKLLPNFLRILAIAFFCISAASPSAVSLFWASSSLFGLGQNLLLMSPRVRRVLRIPKTPSELDKPYSYSFNNFVQKLQLFFLPKK